jgi:NAD(P)-dependent dehydrogenase (short-subunit alcohol dehydrogenase family)
MMCFDSESGAVDLTGQVAIVTGAGRGLGRAFASALAAAGAGVALIARSEDQLTETAHRIDETGRCTMTFAVDVSDGYAAKSIVEQVNERLGPITLLINNAGTAIPFGPVVETNDEQWWRCMEVNLRGPLIYSKAVLPDMMARGQGRIINIASGAGTIGIPYMSAYVVSKAALIRLTEILALEVGGQGIGVFAIEPGTIRTAMAEHALESPEGKKYLPWFSQIFKAGLDVPPDQAVRLVLWLASGKADELSGRLIAVSDDVQKMIEQAEKINQEGLYTLRLRKLK